MLSLAFKKCVSQTQMRHFSTLLVCSRSQARRRITHHLTEFSHPNSTSRMLTTCRLYNTEPQRDSKQLRKYYLPSLLDEPLVYRPTFGTLIKLGLFIEFFIFDKQINLPEFSEGAQQAIQVISEALATQNYEALNDLVDAEIIPQLKQRVDTLSPAQRKFIRVTDNNQIILFISELNKENSKDGRLIKATVVLYYTHDDELMKDGNISFRNWMSHMNEFLVCNYTFERKIINDEIEPWTVKLVNHFSFEQL